MSLIQKIIDSGIVGAGGAGFPTHEKLKGKVEYLIINAAECEPLLQSDQYIMREKADAVIKGIGYVLDVIKADKVVIGLKGKYKKEIEALKKAIKKSKIRIELFESKSFYPYGDEHIMVEMIVKRSVPPGGIPLDVGCVTLNITTVSQIAEAVDSNKPVIEKIITVTGEINNPMLMSVPIGISIKECLDACGGVKHDDFHVVIGGPMMGKVINSDEIESAYITKTDGALIVLPQNHYLVRRQNVDVHRIIRQAHTACIQCRFCTDLCPRYLIGHNLQPHLIMRNVGRLSVNQDVLKEALICSECGICEMYACPMGLSPRMVNIHVKEIFKNKEERYTKQTGDIESKREINGRRIPTERLIARLNLSKYKKYSFNKARNIETKTVVIYLQQHIGVPSVPIVKVGDLVRKGDLIAARKGLGANIHASIDGKVTEVCKKYIKLGH
jgi:RnfABCDGE-type electron transport complex C subunit